MEYGHSLLASGNEALDWHLAFYRTGIPTEIFRLSKPTHIPPRSILLLYFSHKSQAIMKIAEADE